MRLKQTSVSYREAGKDKTYIWRTDEMQQGRELLIRHQTSFKRGYNFLAVKARERGPRAVEMAPPRWEKLSNTNESERMVHERT
jgi:hypothetical protein